MNKHYKSNILTAFILTLILVLPVGTVSSAPPKSIDIEFWPYGKVYYMFDRGFSKKDKERVEAQMIVWEKKLTLPDPGGGYDKSYIDFIECDLNHCKNGGYVLIRYNRSNEKNNICSFIEGGIEKVGYNKNIPTILHISKSIIQEPNTVRHELGHCLGLWHEFNRGDADAWLVEKPDKDGALFSDCKGNDLDFCTKAALMPVLGNYDYDSLMHYTFDNPELVVRDQIGNSFGRINLDSGPSPTYISQRDISRLLQYYAYEQNHNWGFFESLSLVYKNRNGKVKYTDNLPYSYLSPSKVKPIGTPAIAYQGTNNQDIFIRGSDKSLYWGRIRKNTSYPITWEKMGSGFASDPAAVSRGNGQIDVVAVKNNGKLVLFHYQNGKWAQGVDVNRGYPVERIKRIGGEYIGPAITSRTANSLDVFVVTTKGFLSFTTIENGSWSAWRTLGSGYKVTAQPAAIALSTRKIQLAINESDYYLYEPQLNLINRTPLFTLGSKKAEMASRTSPALARRKDSYAPYRVLIVNTEWRLSHRFSTGSWIDIGGIPRPGTGVSAVASSDYGAYIVINGEDATGCDKACARDSKTGKPLSGINPFKYIQPGGLWIRIFR